MPHTVISIAMRNGSDAEKKQQNIKLRADRRVRYRSDALMASGLSLLYFFSTHCLVRKLH